MARKYLPKTKVRRFENGFEIDNEGCPSFKLNRYKPNQVDSAQQEWACKRIGYLPSKKGYSEILKEMKNKTDIVFQKLQAIKNKK